MLLSIPPDGVIYAMILWHSLQEVMPKFDNNLPHSGHIECWKPFQYWLRSPWLKSCCSNLFVLITQSGHQFVHDMHNFLLNQLLSFMSGQHKLLQDLEYGLINSWWNVSWYSSDGCTKSITVCEAGLVTIYWLLQYHWCISLDDVNIWDIWKKNLFMM